MRRFSEKHPSVFIHLDEKMSKHRLRSSVFTVKTVTLIVFVDCNSLSIRKRIYSLNFKRTFYNNFPDEDKCILFTDSIISTITCHQEVQNERNGVIILYLSTAYRNCLTGNDLCVLP